MNNGTIPSTGKLVGKSLLLAVLVLFAWLSVLVAYYQIRDTVESKTDSAEMMRRLDYNYYKPSYADLYDTMTIYDLYDREVYGQYWEVVDASQDYYDYILWSRAAARGYEGAEEKAEAFREEVLLGAENCRYPLNQTILDEFAEKTR